MGSFLLVLARPPLVLPRGPMAPGTAGIGAVMGTGRAEGGPEPGDGVAPPVLPPGVLVPPHGGVSPAGRHHGHLAWLGLPCEYQCPVTPVWLPQELAG